MFHYRIILDAQVDARKRAVVSELMSLAAADLGLQLMPELYWFIQDPSGEVRSPEDCNGRAGRDGVGLRADIPLRELARAALHEVRHIRQFQEEPRYLDEWAGKDSFWLRRIIEDTASDYEQSALKRFAHVLRKYENPQLPQNAEVAFQRMKLL